MEPNFQSPVSNPQEGRSKTSVIFLILIFALLLIVLYVLGTSFKKGDVPANTEVEVTQVDLNQAEGDQRLPAGFPRDIPVEPSGAFESYTMNYTDRGVIQYTVSFNSADSLDALYTTYTDYVASAGFEVISSVSDSSTQRTLYASRAGDDINIVISAEEGGSTVVQISYLDRN